jgi:hypothetical protein
LLRGTVQSAVPDAGKTDRRIGATPESRNEKLASAFRRYRICEERGTGFQKVIQDIELFGLPRCRSPRTKTPSASPSARPAPCRHGHPERIEACYQHAVLQYLPARR